MKRAGTLSQATRLLVLAITVATLVIAPTMAQAAAADPPSTVPGLTTSQGELLRDYLEGKISIDQLTRSGLGEQQVLAALQATLEDKKSAFQDALGKSLAQGAIPDEALAQAQQVARSIDAVVQRAVLLLPASAGRIVEASVASFPTQAASIVTAATTAEPTQVASIVTAAATTAPDQKDVIIAAATNAAPGGQTAVIIAAANSTTPKAETAAATAVVSQQPTPPPPTVPIAITPARDDAPPSGPAPASPILP